MNQIWHRYETWEDWKAGMWRKVTPAEERELLSVAVEFTGNHLLYGRAMIRAVREWPIAAEHNLTDPHTNQRAWVGHAGAAIERNLPEYIVRQAWGMLTERQQNLANAQAEKAIQFWRRNYSNPKHHAEQFMFQF